MHSEQRTNSVFSLRSTSLATHATHKFDQRLIYNALLDIQFEVNQFTYPLNVMAARGLANLKMDVYLFGCEALEGRTKLE